MSEESNISPAPGPTPPPLPRPIPALPIGYAEPLGRPLPPPGKLSFPQQAARASWIAPCISLGLGILNNGAFHGAGPGSRSDSVAQIVIGGVSALMIVTGLVLGILALFAVRRHGREKILTPAIVGVCVNGLLLATMVMGFLFAMSVAKRSRAAALAVASSITAQQANESITKSPGWVGQTVSAGAKVVLASIGRDTPMGREIKDDFATDGLAMLVMINNAGGHETMAVDAGDFSIVLNDGTTRTSISPDTLLQSTRFDKRQLMATYPWTAAVPAGAAGIQNMVVIFPPDVQPEQIDRVLLMHDGKRIVIIGRVLTVEEKAANVARANAAGGPPPAP